MMYKRWMTFFLILIFMPIHLSIAEKIMRINSLPLSILFTLVELALSENLPKRYFKMFSIIRLALPILYFGQFFRPYPIRHNSSCAKFITFMVCTFCGSLCFGTCHGRNLYARYVTGDSI